MVLGREAEREAIGRLLEGAREGRSGTLVIRGEAGVGKSALLSDAAERAGELSVLRGTGVESESELAFAALHQVLRPALDRLDRLPPPQAAALRGAFGLSTERVDDRFMISLATLSLLSEAAGERGLLVLVDDAQWLDEPSAAALLFTARRLEAEGVALLVAVREDEASPLPTPGLPEMGLAGLESAAAHALLSAVAGDGLAPAVCDRLVEATGGNPLALIELPAVLNPEQRAGREPLCDPLPLGLGAERRFAARAKRLDEGAQTLLLVAAADDTGELGVILEAAASLGVESKALESLEAAGLARVRGARLELRHPLVRSAVYGDAPVARRRRAHVALAEALADEADADRRAWHRAAAALGSDAEIAAELERTAERARRRAGYGAAAAALQRAAELTPAGALRAARLVAAADAAVLGGRHEQAAALLERAGALEPDPVQCGEIARLRGAMIIQRGIPGDACDVILPAVDLAAPVGRSRALEMLIAAGKAAAITGRISQLVTIGLRAAELGPGEGPEERLMVALLVGVAHASQGDTDRAAPFLREARSLAETLDDPRSIFCGGTAAIYLGDEVSALGCYQRAVARARAIGAMGVLPFLLQYLAGAEAWSGRVENALADATEGLRLARETGHDNAAAHHLATLARIAALHGREDDCRSCAEDALDLATPRGLALPATDARMALGELDLVLGRFAEAMVRFEAITAAGPGAHPVMVMQVLPNLVECALRAERRDVARAAAQRFAGVVGHTAQPTMAALVARTRALVAEPGAAGPYFEEALRHHAQGAQPIAEARTRLLYGEFLRRERRRTEARACFRTALDTFERVGSRPLAERARAELRATGESARRRDPSALDQLTPQELQVARFVARGATNKEVAAQLFLSPRTVEYHLRKVFPKLGVASRAELIRLRLDEVGSPAE